MKLKCCSFVAAGLLGIHVVDDFTRQRVPFSELIFVFAIVAIWIFATIRLTTQRLHLTIVTIGSVIGIGAPILHIIKATTSVGTFSTINLALLCASSIATLILSICRLAPSKR